MQYNALNDEVAISCCNERSVNPGAKACRRVPRFLNTSSATKYVGCSIATASPGLTNNDAARLRLCCDPVVTTMLWTIVGIPASEYRCAIRSRRRGRPAGACIEGNCKSCNSARSGLWEYGKNSHGK